MWTLVLPFDSPLRSGLEGGEEGLLFEDGLPSTWLAAGNHHEELTMATYDAVINFADQGIRGIKESAVRDRRCHIAMPAPAAPAIIKLAPHTASRLSQARRRKRSPR